MTTEPAIPRLQSVSKRHAELATVLAIPLLFLLAGMALRYAAFVSLSDEPGLSAYMRALCRWDCSWYLGIAEKGYEGFPIPNRSNVGRWAFFPLYPLLVRGLGNLSSLPLLRAAVLASMAAAYAACLAAWPLLERDLRAYALYSAFLLGGPLSFQFTSVLTEPLFVLLTSCVFLALKRPNYLAAGAFSALLSATRLVGVFIVVATVIRMYQDYRSHHPTAALASFPAWVLARPRLLVAILVSPLGLFAYMLFLHVTVGDGFAFVHVQRAFGRVAGNPVLYLWEGISAMPKGGFLPSAPQWSALAVIVGLALCAVLAVRRQYEAALFCALCIVLPMITNLSSMVRYVGALAPLIMLSAQLMSRPAPLWLAALVLALVGCYLVTQAWMGGHLALV